MGTHFGQPSPNSTSFFRPQIKGKVFLLLVVFSEVLTCFLVGYGEYPCDGLAHGVAARRESVDSPTDECNERTSWSALM